MALLDIFKKKKEEKRGEVKKEIKKTVPANLRVPKQIPATSETKIKANAQSSVLASPASEPRAGGRKLRKRTQPSSPSRVGSGYRILKMPRISEKATDLAEKNQYLFEVYPRTNKNEIKQAIRDIYGVDAVSVRVINMPRKKRRVGKTEGFKIGYKKAIVKIGEGHKIEVLPR